MLFVISFKNPPTRPPPKLNKLKEKLKPAIPKDSKINLSHIYCKFIPKINFRPDMKKKTTSKYAEISINIIKN